MGQLRPATPVFRCMFLSTGWTGRDHSVQAQGDIAPSFRQLLRQCRLAKFPTVCFPALIANSQPAVDRRPLVIQPPPLLGAPQAPWALTPREWQDPLAWFLVHLWADGMPRQLWWAPRSPRHSSGCLAAGPVCEGRCQGLLCNHSLVQTFLGEATSDGKRSDGRRRGRADQPPHRSFAASRGGGLSCGELR